MDDVTQLAWKRLGFDYYFLSVKLQITITNKSQSCYGNHGYNDCDIENRQLQRKNKLTVAYFDNYKVTSRHISDISFEIPSLANVTIFC